MISEEIVRNKRCNTEFIDKNHELYYSSKKKKKFNGEKREKIKFLNSNSELIFFDSNLPKEFHKRQKYMSIKKKRKIFDKKRSLSFGFRPKLISKNDFSRNKNKMPIGTFLFEKSKKKNQFKPLLKPLKNSPNLKASKFQTQRIINIKKKRISRQIFNFLDNDNDDIIKIEDINVSKIDNNILLVLAPLFIEIENYTNFVEYPEFESIFENYYDKLDPCDKLVFDYKKEVEKLEEFNFNPKLCKKSLKIAELLKKKSV